MKSLPLSTTLSLPLDAATQTFAFIGRKGSGKTYGAGKLVELLIDGGIQVAILDTVGNFSAHRPVRTTDMDLLTLPSHIPMVL